MLDQRAVAIITDHHSKTRLLNKLHFVSDLLVVQCMSTALTLGGALQVGVYRLCCFSLSLSNHCEPLPVGCAHNLYNLLLTQNTCCKAALFI